MVSKNIRAEEIGSWGNFGNFESIQIQLAVDIHIVHAIFNETFAMQYLGEKNVLDECYSSNRAVRKLI